MATVYQQGVQAKPISQTAFLQRILQVLTEEHEVKDEDLVRHEVGAPDLDSQDLQRILQEALKEQEANGGEGE